ncbi:MAG: IclR family transcriptional regulator [Pseudomonadota bacterium]
MKTSSPPQGAQAAIRAIRLLKAFTVDQPELSLAELSKRIGLNKTTAHRLLAALESEALVEKTNVRGTYRLGPGTVALGAQAQSTNHLRVRTRPTLERLARLTRETVSLEVLLGEEVMTLDEVDGGQMLNATGYVGMRWPAYATSSGKAILAKQSVEDDFFSKPFESLTQATIPDFISLQKDLSRTRRLGYATDIDELEHGYTSVAVALSDAAYDNAAICIGGPSARLSRDRRKELGRALIREIEHLRHSVN